ncbi:MAG TPA: adenylate/guanylate cyclase domain-containing protein [Anaerolineales bacterium]|nr:adenylate/guanylate cyclase domain-containing protein [Anaerolineales bacterium]
MSTPSDRAWVNHILPILIAGIAVLMLVLSPFWAADWYRTPFLGMLLEPNNVVSQIASAGWPARDQGVLFADQLLTLNGQPIPDASAFMTFLQQNGTRPVRASFARRAGGTFALTVMPLAHPPLGDLFTLFIVPYLVSLALIGIGLWTYTLRSDQRASRALLAFTSALSIGTSTFLDMDTTRHAVLFWALSLGVIGGSLVHLSFVFPQPMRFVLRRPSLRWLGWIVFILLAAPTSLAILRPSDPYFYINTWQWGYLFITLGFVLFLGTLIYRVFRSNLSNVRQQSRVIIFGAIIAFIPALYYIAPLAFGVFTQFYAWLVFPALIVFPLSITYAVIRYRLLDVDRFFSRALTYLLTLSIALAAFYALLALFSLSLQRAIRASDPLVIAAYLLLLVIGFNPLRGLIQRGIDRLFYRAPADYRRALTSLSRHLAVTPNLNQTLRTLEDQVTQALAPEKFVLYLYNDDLGKYFPHATRGDSAPSYQVEDPLIQLIASARTPIWFPTDGPLPPALPDSAPAYRRLMGFTFAPLHYEGKLTGFMMLGPRRSGDLYTGDDLDFLAAVAAQSALALENVRLFANLRRNLDQTMEMKNLMDNIFASIATGIITTDVEGHVTLLNRAAENILGVDVSRVIGEPLAKAVPVLGVELEDAASYTLTRGETVTSTELSNRVPERGDLFLRLSVSPLRDAYLGTKGATLVFEDLTERHKLEAERELIRRTFGHVVAPRVRDRLLANPDNLQLDGVKRLVTALFADMSGFTTYSEKHDPETVFSVLNQYLALAAQAILEEEGTLDKFMGDAVLGIWNSPDLQPDHALRAARAALNIVRRSIEAHRSLKDPEQHMTFRIGITTGPAMIGNVGTAELFNYTAIGDTVNLAQRLQASARPGQILLESTTYEIVKDLVEAGALDPIAVKGRQQAAQVFELKGLKES